MTATLLAAAFGSLVVHELAHGWTALALGDPSARDAGRLSLNPLAHVSITLTILLPLATALVSHGAWVLGGGRPVPVDRARLGWARYLVVIIAGPTVNVVIACVAHVVGLTLLRDVNIALAFLNLLPLPFLDGGNALRAVRYAWHARKARPA